MSDTTPGDMELPAGGLRTARLLLRSYRPTDAEAVREGFASPAAQLFVPGLGTPFTLDDARRWLARRDTIPGVHSAVVVGDEDTAVGGIGLSAPDSEGVTEVGYWAVPAVRGRGYVREAVAALTEWAFAHGAARAEMTVEPANTASAWVARRAGYHRESVRRSAGTGPAGRVDLATWVRLPPAARPPGPAAGRTPLPWTEASSDGVATVRPIRAEDAAAVLGSFGRPDPRWPVPVRPWTAERVADWCAEAGSEWLGDVEARFAVLDAGSGSVAGSVRLRPLWAGVAEVGWGLDPAWRGRGLGRRAVALVAEWAFAAGFARLEAAVDVDNVPSHRLATAAGFRAEGVRRGWLDLPGGRRDATLYGLLPGDRSAVPG